jgi:hypothetical protein
MDDSDDAKDYSKESVSEKTMAKIYEYVKVKYLIIMAVAAIIMQ